MMKSMSHKRWRRISAAHANGIWYQESIKIKKVAVSLTITSE
jgi:hypothetical protein